MGKMQPGSPTLFMIIKFLNITFGICALALSALGIWLWREFGAFNIIEIVFITLGVFQFLLVVFIWTAKTSVIRLRLYFYILFVLFVLQLTAIIVSFATGQKIINQIAKDSQQQIQQLRNYLNFITYYCIGTLVVMLLQLGFVYCYIGSLRNRNFEFDYKFLDEGGNKLTIEQKNQLDKDKINEKYERKRRQLYDKYPKYRQYKEDA